MSSEDQADPPEWVLVLEGLGWLVIGLGIIAVAFIGSRLFHDERLDRLQIILSLGLGIGSAAFFLGGIPIAVSRSVRLVPSRWRLWSKLVLLIGGLLSISIPAAVYGVLPAGIEPSRLPGELVGPLDPELLQDLLIVGGPPFLIGAILISVALHWGRIKLPPASPAVFD